MAEPFMSEMRMFSFDWAPRGWASCNGQLIPLNDNQALYALIGTSYGGDGRTTFGLPDMRGRVPVQAINSQTGIRMGTKTGLEQVTLTEPQMAAHTHQVKGRSTLSTKKTFTNNVFAIATDAKTTETFAYGNAQTLVSLNTKSVSANGGSQPHNNMQPSLVVNFCIATTGLFPSRN